VVLDVHHFAFSDEPEPVTTVVKTLPETPNLREATDAFQREIISQVLAQNQRNWAASARALDIDVANLHRLAKRLGLKR
jgi:anaerobic nitric oxide reductase transcription regulator